MAKSQVRDMGIGFGRNLAEWTSSASLVERNQGVLAHENVLLRQHSAPGFAEVCYYVLTIVILIWLCKTGLEWWNRPGCCAQRKRNKKWRGYLNKKPWYRQYWDRLWGNKYPDDIAFYKRMA